MWFLGLLFCLALFFGFVKGKGLLCCLGFLITASPLCVRVDSDVVEEAYLKCRKRSGRV